MIPQQTIERIIDTNDIVSIISEHVTLKKRGVNHIGNCPFHSEKTPSFVVSPAKGIYKCFGCGASGNVAKFVQDIDQIPWIEAIRQLAARVNIELPKKEMSPEERAAMQARDRLFMANDFAQAHFVSNLAAGAEYMIGRGFDKEDLERFGIGYAIDDFNGLKSAAKNKGLKEAELLTTGLLIKNDGGKVYDRFRGRIMFPIHGVSGKIAGFTGRIVDSEAQAAKYMNSSDSEIFHKSELLYGLFQAKTSIVREGRCNLVEGNTDVMRWHKVGVSNTVATCGTALTPAHARLIHRFTDNLTIVFDGDAAGVKAAIRGIDVCLAEGLNVYVAVLPEGEDPDSFGRQKSEKELEAWIEDNEKDFVLFLADMGREDLVRKPAEKARIISELRDTISKVPDAGTRQVYYETVAKVFDTDIEAFLKNAPAPIDSEIFGMEANKEAIKAADEIFVYTDKDLFMQDVARGLENSLVIPGFPLKAEQVGALELLSRNLVFMDPLPAVFDLHNEPESIREFKRLQDRGFRVDVVPPPGIEIEGEDHVSFTDMYFRIVRNNARLHDSQSMEVAVELCAAYLAKQGKTTISIKTAEVAKLFGLTKADFEKILKPHVNRQKSKSSIDVEAIEVDNERFVIDDPDRLPDYVDRQFLAKYRYFPVQNKRGQRVFYMFQGENGQMFRVANFYIEPQFQVRSDDPNKNKRIVKVNHAERNTQKFMEIPSDAMIEFGTFKKFMWRQGPYFFRNGKAQHLDMILDSIALDFPETDELEIYGQQEEGFYAFSNAVFADGKIEYMNSLGLVSYKDNTYYSPSVSCIFKDVRKDSDKYAADRYFIYRDTKKINLHDWADLMMKVYKYNNNGHWAVIMAILSAFRSDIFKIDRLFTTLFLIGPTGCGKSELAQSIRAIFMHPDAPMFNLNSGTDAAFFTTLERYRDAPVIMEEYNDMQISDAKFQGLKAAVYDGEGKTKRKDATSKDLDQSQVNAVPIILGQESPERDDASLANRTVIRPVKKVEYWTEEETANFQKLKQLEKLGLTNILVDILSQRDLVQKMYGKKLRLVQKQMRDDMRKDNISFQTRILNTVSLFAAMVKLIEEEVTEFKLPFGYKEFYPMAIQVLVGQSESIQTTNRLAVFFDTLMMLAEDNGPRGVVRNKDYKVEEYDSIKVRRGRKEEDDVSFDQPTKLLFLRMDVIHQKYKSAVGAAEHLKMNNLMTYIKDHPAYIGQVPVTTFRWETEVRTPNDSGQVISMMQEEFKRTSATVLNYDILADPNNPTLDLGESSLRDANYYKELKEERMTAGANNMAPDFVKDIPKGADKLPF